MQLRIAICDDTAADREAIAAALNGFLTARGILARVESFAHPDKLLIAARQKPFDLYLLDVVMPMIDGLAVVRELRAFQRDAPVVYFTTSKDHALAAFGVHALGYVVKPYTRAQFDETLDCAIRSVVREAGHFVLLKTAEGHSRLDAGTIVYVTASKVANCKTLHLENGKTLDVRLTLDALAEALRRHVPFFADGRYALINPYRVRSISGEMVTFDNGATLSIHRPSVAALRNAVSALPW